MKIVLRGLLAALLCAAGLPALAADAVTDAMQQAYAPYRAALFQTNAKNAEGSAQAIAQAQQAWGAIVARFGAQAPAPYDRDPGFAGTLAQVNAVYTKAADEIRAGRLPEAHETLEAARDLLADLRRRNQVVVFSDHMNAYHAEMEHALTQAPALLDQPQGLQRLTASAGVLAYLARRLPQEAPAALRADAEFVAGVAAVTASVDGLMSALMAGDVAAARAALGRLKGPYGKLFLKFG
jgi:hypothetical protein